MSQAKHSPLPQKEQLLGHPCGLYTLFFAEMWERFSYYGMRALLLFYMMKGFLGFGDSEAYAVYGAYTSLVYLTPFFGGMIADKLIGARKAVVIGGVLMALGHLVMMVESEIAFFSALALLIVGNGFFKPNISTIVGSLYPQNSSKRDGGFTIFYIGINLGAAMSPLLCGYIGETYGWHYGFGLATAGMIAGLAVFVVPNLVSQITILAAALVAAFGLIMFKPDNPYAISINFFVAIALVVSAGVAIIALSRGGLPAAAGQPADDSNQGKKVGLVLLGTLISFPIFVLLVSGFSVMPRFDQGVKMIPSSWVEQLEGSSNGLLQVLGTLVNESSRPAGAVLILCGLAAAVYLVFESIRLDKIARHRMYVVFVLTFFSLLFWSFFEQAGSSVNNFTDRNVNRVVGAKKIVQADVGNELKLRVPLDTIDEKLKAIPVFSQEFLGHENASPEFPKQLEAAVREVEANKGKLDKAAIDEQVKTVLEKPKLTITALTYLREYAKTNGSKEASAESREIVTWTIAEDNVGVGLGGSEIPASVFQSVNPMFIMILGLVFSALWGILRSISMEPSTPIKFALGLIQLGMGFGCFWYGAQTADGDGMVAVSWLLLGYLFQTTGELCLSPVGLAMITKLSPGRLVSTVMGTWFLATAFSQFLAAIIAQFTGVGHGGGSESTIPIPLDTVNVYGDVFKIIAISAVVSGVICLLLSPLLMYWMHEGEDVAEDSA